MAASGSGGGSNKGGGGKTAHGTADSGSDDEFKGTDLGTARANSPSLGIAGQRFDNVNETFRLIANRTAQLRACEPVQDGEGDKMWNTFKVEFVQGCETLQSATSGIAAALSEIADSVRVVARAQEDTEETNEKLAQNILKQIER